METLQKQALDELCPLILSRPDLWGRAQNVLLLSYLMTGKPQPIDPRYPPTHPANGPAMIAMLKIARALLLGDQQGIPDSSRQ